jgi:DNA-directed RNA polymerase specialized sigma24 family protein
MDAPGEGLPGQVPRSLGVDQSKLDPSPAGYEASVDAVPTIDWKEVLTPIVLKKVGAWTASAMNKNGWRGESGATLPGCPSPEDLVHDAVIKTIAGSRRWNRSACSIEQHLIGVVRSDLSHLARGPENRRSRSPDSRIEPMGSEAGWSVARSPNGVMPTWIPEQEIAVEQAELTQIIDHLLQGDPTGQQVARAMMAYEETSSKFLAEHLGLTEADADAAKRRVRRRLTPSLIDRMNNDSWMKADRDDSGPKD